MKFKSFYKKWGKTFWIGVFVFLFGFALRVLKLTSLPIFADEAIYIRWAQIMKAEATLRFIPLSDGKQPLFMWAVIPFLKIFKDPLFAGRFLSTLTGMGTAAGVFTLSYLFFRSKKVSLVALLFYMFSPFTLFFDRMALVDSMLSMFTVWTFIGGYLLAKTKRLDVSLLTGFSLGGALITKSPALFVAILLPVTSGAALWGKKKKEIFKSLVKIIPLWLITYGLGILIYNIQRLGPNFQLLSQRNKDYVYPLSHLLASPTDPFLPFFDRIIEYLWLMGPGLIFLFLLSPFLFSFKEKRIEKIISFILLFFPILVVSEFSKTMTARYVLFVVPIIFVLAASAFLEEKEKRLKPLKILLALFVLTSLYIDFLIITNPRKAPLPRSERSGYLEEWTAGVGIKEVSEIIKKEYQKEGKKIVVGTEGYFGTLPDGLQIYLNNFPEITVIGVGVDIKNLPKSLKESKESGNKTFLVINNSRLHLVGKDPALHNLELIASFDKAERPAFVKEYETLGAKETLYLFEVTSD